ncbi:hypothetical protein [Microbacterium rhizomatis]|uniref:Uncharacterized protein n=1 Tax=Microbacterium rhizomatis TaxID=1631477 RepID=A0A5J5J4P5_9MICO|nr:hypothetical protein [Microbacterium rhizomatis]KAA9110990.1 hypothetical protein F6B43_05055 [Microbacterium rhizomatis]
MRAIERELEQMMRWYPRRWRDLHELTLKGMYLQSADADGASRLSKRDRAALRAAGAFERTRFVLPIATSSLAIVAFITGMFLATFGSPVVGACLWIVVGPSLLALGVSSLVAGRSGGWRLAHLLALVSASAASAVLMIAFRIASERDSGAVDIPGLGTFWAFLLIYAGLIGIVATIALAPSMVRSGVRLEWSLPLGFLSGFCGAIPLAAGVVAGFPAVIASCAVLLFGLRSWRRFRVETLRQPSVSAA